MEVKVNTIDLGILGACLFLISSVPFQGDITSRASLFLRFVDCVDFNMVFRSRVAPRIQNKDYQIDGYSLAKSRNSNLQTFYVYLSAVLINYGCGFFVNYCFFGVLKVPIVFDVILFNLALLLVHFSYNDIVFQRLSTHPLYAMVHSFGVSIFKTKKIARLVTKALTFNADAGQVLIYSIIAMEFTGTCRAIEPILYHMEDISAFNAVENTVFAVAASFDAFADFIAVIILLVGDSIGLFSLLGWLVLPIFAFRWERKVFKKLLDVDLDLAIFRPSSMPLFTVTREYFSLADINYSAMVDSFNEALVSILLFFDDIFVQLQTLSSTAKRPRITFPNLEYNMSTMVFLSSFGFAAALSVLNFPWAASVAILSFGIYDIAVISRAREALDGSFDEAVTSYSEITWMLITIGMFSLAGGESSGNSLHLIFFHLCQIVLLTYLAVPFPLNATVIRSSGYGRLREYTDNVVSEYFEKFFMAPMQIQLVKVKDE